MISDELVLFFHVLTLLIIVLLCKITLNNIITSSFFEVVQVLRAFVKTGCRQFVHRISIEIA